jgi:hypothetical protein
VVALTGSWYGTSAVSAGSVIKTTTCANYTLTPGERIAVKFTYANTATNPLLNVNSQGAKPIYWNGANLPSTQYWSAGAVIEFLYDGSYYHMLGAVKDNTDILDEFYQSIDDKQDVITDLETIRQGAAKGANAVQPDTLNNYLSLNGGTVNGQTTFKGGLRVGPTDGTGVKTDATRIYFGDESYC